jgi:hypothetical protein
MSVCICPSPGCPMEPSPCRLGYEEYDGARYCFEHAGFAHYLQNRHLNCDRRPSRSPEVSS